MTAPALRLNHGFSMLEVLISILITAFGLLGLAGLMSRMQAAETESYQRSQALALLLSMTERITTANPTSAAGANAWAQVGTPMVVGTDDAQPATCTALSGAARDLCEWSNALKGAAETTSGGTNVGAMISARGCIEQLAAPDMGICTPATFRVTVVWQGLSSTAPPSTSCATASYNDPTRLRAVFEQVKIALPKCITASSVP